MNRRIILVAIWLLPAWVGVVPWAVCRAQTVAITAPAAQPVRLAIVSEDAQVSAAADLLTVELSKNGSVTLLERDQIAKALNEQALSAGGGRDFIKLGEILDADGLMIAEVITASTNKFLSIRLIAVKPGVVLQEHLYPWPMKDAGDWSGRVLGQFGVLFPKLAVLPKDAVPLSVVNVRASVNTGEEREQEREVTQLLIDRLAQEPEIFVMERQHLRDATAEKEFKTESTNSPFWTGRYLLDGSLDRDGVDPEKITINARLVSPQGAMLNAIELSGPRKDLPAFAKSITAKVLVALRKSPGTNEWLPSVEADKFFEEARRAKYWGLASEAQEATESAWALGKHSKECAVLLIRCYLDDPALYRGVTDAFLREFDGKSEWDFKYEIAERQPDIHILKPTLRELEFYFDNSPMILTNRLQPDGAWLSLGLELLARTSGILESFYYAAEARQGSEEQLSDLRGFARQIAQILEANDPAGSVHARGGVSLKGLKWADGGYWYEKPEDALRMQRELLETDWHPTYPPWVVGWSWQDRKHVPGLIKAFVENETQSTNPSVRLEGFYLAMARAPVDEFGGFEKTEEQLFTVLWEQRRTIFKITDRNGWIDVPLGPGSWTTENSLSIFLRTEGMLRIKRGAADDPEPVQDEQLANFKIRLRKDFFDYPSNYDDQAFGQLFPQFSVFYSDAEIADLIPLAATFIQAGSTPPSRRAIMDGLVKSLASRSSKTSPDVAAVQPRAEEQAKLVSPVGVPTNGTYETAQFRPLKLPRPPSSFQFGELEPGLQSGIYRQHKLWFEVRYQHTEPGMSQSDIYTQPLFVGVDPETDEQTVIPFPKDLGYPDPLGGVGHYRCCFEVTQDSLYASVQNRLARYRFKEAKWETIPIPMEAGATITDFNGRLYLNAKISILELEPESAAIKILASNRRRPPANFMDEVSNYAALFPGPGNMISVVAGTVVSAYSPTAGVWQKTSLSPHDVDPYRYKPKDPLLDIWPHIRFEKDGEITNAFGTFNERAHIFGGAPDSIVMRCEVPYSVVVANPLHAGYWLVPLKKLEEAPWRKKE